MSWDETHRRWAALREVAALAELTDGELPWNPEYAEIFGDREHLIAALRHRWRQTLDAQLDSHLSDVQLEECRDRLEARNAGVLRILEQAARPERQRVGA